jgi:hypothetical protein
MLGEPAPPDELPLVVPLPLAAPVLLPSLVVPDEPAPELAVGAGVDFTSLPPPESVEHAAAPASAAVAMASIHGRMGCLL